MKYIFFILNIVMTLLGHVLLFFIARYFFDLNNIYIQIAVGIILLFSLFIIVLAPLLIHWRDNILSRALYLVVGLWLGLILNFVLFSAAFFLLLLLPIDWLTNFLIAFKAYLVVIFSLLLLIPEAWSAQVLKVRKFSLRVKNLPSAWENQEIIHISDIHLGPIWRQRFFDKLVEKVNSLKAKAIFITGDLFDGMEANFSWFHQRKFFASAGVFYAFGNHDLILGKEKVAALLNNSNIQILDNRLEEIEGLQILGLSCYDQGQLSISGKKLTNFAYQANKPSVLMYHEPKDVDLARAAGISLQLSGHTHGGQMFPFNIIAKILYRGFVGGFYRFADFAISVSSGAGTWGPPLRLGSRSEIVLIKLLKE